jgi:hypothetical protein
MAIIPFMHSQYITGWFWSGLGYFSLLIKLTVWINQKINQKETDFERPVDKNKISQVFLLSK